MYWYTLFIYEELIFIYMLLQNVSVLLEMERWCELEHFTKAKHLAVNDFLHIWIFFVKLCTYLSYKHFYHYFHENSNWCKNSFERVFPPINHNICIYNFHIDWNSHLQNFTRLSTGLKPVCLEFSIISQKHPTYN